MPPYNGPNQRPPPPRNELEEWFNSIPPVTRSILAASIVIPLAGSFGVVHMSNFLLIWKPVLAKFQLWRLVTCFFLYSISLEWAFSLAFLYQFSSQLEREHYLGRTADYLYFIMVTCGIQVVVAYFAGNYVLSSGLSMAITYLWSQKNRGFPVTFMFGLRFQAQHLPLVRVLYEFIMSGGNLPIASIVGWGAGYFYNYFVEEYPRAAGVRLLDTPNWLRSLFPPTTGNRGGFANAGNAANNVRLNPGRADQPSNSVFGGHQWGRGNRLG
ncbi:Der1-like family-domain-containing protein [Umbelopsis sp. PMI_123]|nr:Der1-like family-domain-containing protein [Umbelopsis sp. PMI_123]